MKTTRWAWVLVVPEWLLLGGCQVVESRSKSLVYFSATSAGYAGRFRIAQGRWPANPGELEEFMCMKNRADSLGLRRLGCDEVVSLPYRMEFAPADGDLRIRYIDASGERICSLRLLAPATGTTRQLFPMIIIKSTLFDCRGGTFEQGRVNRE